MYTAAVLFILAGAPLFSQYTGNIPDQSQPARNLRSSTDDQIKMYERMAEQAEFNARTKFSKARMCAHTLDFYRRVAAEAGRAA